MADNPTLVLIGVLVLLFLLTGWIEPNYLSAGGIRNTLLQAAPLGILAGAQTILMLSGGIDLSAAMIATAAANVAANQSPNGAAVAILVGLVVGLIVGTLNGVGVTVFRVNPLIMTLAMAAILLGLFTAWMQTILVGSTQVAPFIRLLGGGSFWDGRIPYSVLVWALVSALLIWLLRRAGWGRLLYAIGDNETAVRLAGVRVWQVRIAAYMVAGLLAAAGGMLLAGRNGTVDLQIGNAFLLPSIAAVVIGGTSLFGGRGSIIGSVLGAFIVGVFNTGLSLAGVEDYWQMFAAGCLVIIAVALDQWLRRATQ
jgi:ribose transport system permease protein